MNDEWLTLGVVGQQNADNQQITLDVDNQQTTLDVENQQIITDVDDPYHNLGCGWSPGTFRPWINK